MRTSWLCYQLSFNLILTTKFGVGIVFRKAVTLFSKDGEGEIHPSSDIESQKSSANSGGTIV